MYIIGNTFLNPLQIVKIKFFKGAILIKDFEKAASFVITMSDGYEYEIDSDNCKNVEESLRRLVWEIDTSNGVKIGGKKDD